ncbi:MAG: RluA family pseudouridine synthase [Verrucomicrobia bacterium]|nr:RluA family pseudouridine synthase [Verrucomicrobiota bacterium]MCH8513370.1 RluA family pseudouridine synthase [Kiritimatiellia bacterium]
MPNEALTRAWSVRRSNRPMTLQDVLREQLSLSGRQAKALLDQRNVFVNGSRVWMARHEVKAGDQIEVHGIPSDSKRQPPKDIEILFRDAWLIAVNKPPGLVSDREKDSVEARLRIQCNLPDLRALHRLDRDTSGVLLFTVTANARAPYLELFRNTALEKTYHALVRGTPPAPRFVVDTRLDGKEALTKVFRLQQQGGYCLLSCEIPTGRTHQIRRHLLQHGLVIVGERQYAQKGPAPALERSIPRQMLHAQRLALPCPHLGVPIELFAAPPSDFQEALKIFQMRAPKSCPGTWTLQ